MKRLVRFLLIASLLSPSLALALDSKGAAYFGGTVSTFVAAKEPVEGMLDTRTEDALGFKASDKPYAGQSVSIPYDSIIDLEYGQKAGRRIGAAVGTAILLGPLGLLTLFSKKRKHYLTVGFKDAQGRTKWRSWNSAKTSFGPHSRSSKPVQARRSNIRTTKRRNLGSSAALRHIPVTVGDHGGAKAISGATAMRVRFNKRAQAQGAPVHVGQCRGRVNVGRRK